MKKYLKEIIIFSLQVLIFYILPLFAGPTDIMGLVLIIIFSTFALSLVLGAISGNLVKYFYPLATSAVFIPSVFIYYNSSALVHSLWYLVISLVGMAIGTGIYYLSLLIVKLIKNDIHHSVK